MIRRVAMMSRRTVAISSIVRSEFGAKMIASIHSRVADFRCPGLGLSRNQTPTVKMPKTMSLIRSQLMRNRAILNCFSRGANC